MTNTLKIISAGAGAGKTTRLSGEIIEVIANIPPEKVVATTFTRKAAEELIERIRLELLKDGEMEKATRILDGYVGTMNSVFARLIEEFALQLGLSPVQNLLEENEALMMFNSIAYQSIAKYESLHYKALSRYQLIGGEYPWSKSVLAVIKLARENGLKAEQVKQCAQYSIEEAQKWYRKEPLETAGAEENLINAMKEAVKGLPAPGDTTKTTVEAITKAKDIINHYERHGYLTWAQWARASKIKPGAKSRAAFEEVGKITSMFPHFPELYDDFETVIKAVFHCAADAMELYEQEKKVRGLIDFTDQEYLALNLLNDPKFVDVLKERIEAVFVDEFQDSSPLQIALNMKLREIAKSTTWVGDLKQAIYGFRGTDPDLMKTAMELIPNIERAVLSDSWRSRKSLVDFVNDLFTPVFETVGLPADLVKLNPQRNDDPEQKHSLELWQLDLTAKKDKEMQLIAKGILEVLQQKAHYKVVDKNTRQLRDLKPSDIAVLCRTNPECSQLANSLTDIGIEVMLGGEGLLQTTEAIYAISTFRYLLNPKDTLALAQIIHLSSEQWANGEWLHEWLSNEQFLNEVTSTHPVIQALSNKRQEISNMSPSEMLDFALVKGEVDLQVLRWGNGQQRLANIDRLRKLVQQYEHGASLNGYAATAGGCLLFLEDAKNDKELNRRAESVNENAVNVLTYHRSKGLEWPFVILYSLDKSTISSRKPPEVFGRVLAVSTKPFNVNSPLDGRMLYYWPWPFGDNTKDVGFNDYVQNSNQLQHREQQLLEETQRLLYVGMTRARDYLILAAKDYDKAKWLKEQQNNQGEGVIGTIIQSGENAKLSINGLPYEATYKSLRVDEEEAAMGIDPQANPIYIGVNLEQQEFELATFKPSAAKFSDLIDAEAIEGIEFEVEEEAKVTILKHEIPQLHIESIGERTSIVGSVDMVDLGLMLHTFLATDSLQKRTEKRLQIAEMIQRNFCVDAVTTKSMLQMSGNLFAFLDTHYPTKRATNREYPLHLKVNGRKAEGIVDLLVELKDGWVIIDHKTFPGAPDKWAEKAYSYLPQLQVYAYAIEKASGKPVKEAWIHMPVVAQMVKFTADMLENMDLKKLVLQ